MPCIKLSSGKTVCYGDEPTTYSQGGTIFFNHQPMNFDPGGKTGGNFHQFGTPQNISNLTAPNMKPATMEQFRKQQAQIVQNRASSPQSSGLKPVATTKPTNVLKANPTSTVKMPPVNTRIARTDSTQVARPNAQLFQAKLDQKENDPLGYAAAAKLAESRRGQSFGERLLDDSLQWMGENPELTALGLPLLALGAAEVIPGIAAETALLEAPAALTEAFETANSLYKGYQTINKGIDAGKNIASGNYAGAAGNVLDIGKSFIPAAKLNVAKDFSIDAASGALQGYGETGTLEGTARGAFDNTAGDRLAQQITGNKDTFGRNIIKDQLKSVEAGFKEGGFKEGGKTNKSLTEKDSKKAIDRAVKFEEGWLNSPMYKQMLEESVKKDDPVGFDSQYVNYITQKRKEGLGSWDAKAIPFDEKTREQFYPNKSSYQYQNNLHGFNYSEPFGETEIFGQTVPTLLGLPDLKASPDFFLLNPPGTAYNNEGYWVSPQKGYNQTFLKNTLPLFTFQDTSAHELSHATDWGGKFIPTSDEKLMASLADLKSNPGKIGMYDGIQQTYGQYVGMPTETRARLQSLRTLAKDRGLYDPYTQKATMDVLERFKKANNSQYRQLKHIYSDEDILKMLNTVSMNEDTNNSSMV